MARVPDTLPRGPGGILSFTRAKPAGVQTLDALMLRQKELADRQQSLSTERYPGFGTIAGGLGNVINQFATGRAEHAAAAEEAAGRAALAELIGGWDPASSNAQQTIGQISQRDPDLATGLLSQLAQYRRDKAAAEAAAAQRGQDRQWELSDTASQRAYETQKTSDQRSYEETADDVETVSGDAAKAMGLDPARTYQVSRRTGAATDITPKAAEMWEEVPPPEGAPPGQRFQRNKTTGEMKAIGGGGVTIQNIPAEIAARVGMSDVFQTRYPEILKDIEAGDVTGIVDYATGVAGQGRVGEVHREIKSGVDALVRNLTGAGKSESEARDYASRYLPQAWDTAESLKSKIVGLNEELTGVRSAVTQGRNAPPPPDTGTPPPTGQSYQVGQTVTFDDGTTATYKGGPVDDINSWTDIKPGAGAR